MLALVLTLPGRGPALAAEPTSQERHLLLEVWINGYNLHVVASVTEDGGVLLIPTHTLDEIGIRREAGAVRSAGLVDLTKFPGLTARIDERDQRLRLQASPGRLTLQAIDLRPAEAAFHPATAGTGLVIDYDGVVMGVGQGAPLSAGVDFRVAGFMPWGALTTTGFATAGAGRNRLTRRDTAIEIDDQRALRQWTFGDAISAGLSWSRSVRFAGLHLATDYSLEPELVTQPLPRFFGQTAVPASVDVFVDATKVLTTSVRPGPFEIRNLPVLTGGGTAQVVVRDQLGRDVTQAIPFYTTPRLLAPGLAAYALDVGALRRGYGIRSFDYGGAMAVATLRYGLTERLTLEAHSEGSADVFVAGGGAILAVPPYGVIEASAAASRTSRGDGSLVAVAAQSQTHPLNLFASYTATSGRYADIASIDGRALPRQRFQAGVGLSAGRHGSLALSWIDIRDRSASPTRLGTASYTLSLGRGLHFGVTGVADAKTGKMAAEAFLSIPLGGRTNLGAAIRGGSGSSSETLSVARAASPDGGLGYRVRASTGQQDLAEANLTWIGEHGRVDAGISSIGGQTAGRVGASGALIVMDGAVFATRTSDDAFALVRTGEPNVEVYHENRSVGRAGARGKVLVPDLNAYESNRISVDPGDYPMSLIVTDPERVVVPRRHSGVTVDFSPSRLHPARATVRLETGDYPAAGTPLFIEDGREPLVVGYRGQIFIPDLTTKLTGKIALATTWCHFEIEPPLMSPVDEIPQLAPVVCRMENAGGP